MVTGCAVRGCGFHSKVLWSMAVMLWVIMVMTSDEAVSGFSRMCVGARAGSQRPAGAAAADCKPKKHVSLSLGNRNFPTNPETEAHLC